MAFITHNQKGFTLIETLFAVLIFSAALVALMTIASRGISAAGAARQQMVAHYLAQEGLEIARNVRDVNYLTASAWDAGISQCGPSATNACKVVYSSRSLTPCGSSCVVLENLNTYADTGAPSLYTRQIYVVPANPDPALNDEYKVVSVVTWTSKTIKRTVTLQTILKKWR